MELMATAGTLVTGDGAGEDWPDGDAQTCGADTRWCGVVRYGVPLSSTEERGTWVRFLEIGAVALRVFLEDGLAASGVEVDRALLLVDG